MGDSESDIGMFRLAGLGIAMRNAALVIWGPWPRAQPPFLGTQELHVAGLVLPSQSLLIIAVTLLVLLGQYLLFSGTRLGRMLRATAMDQEVARLMGIPVRRTIALTFGMRASSARCAGPGGTPGRGSITPTKCRRKRRAK